MKKDFVIDKNSWHFKFINAFERWDKEFYPEEKMPKDFCSYWANFASHAFSIVTALVVLIGIVLIFCILPLYMLTGLLVDCFTGMFGYKTERGNLFVTKYRAWKEKYCPMVTYK